MAGSYVTFEVQGEGAAALGPRARCTFGIDGGRIGRGADCRWVLEGPGIHRLHAIVRFLNGMFFIEKSGENRVAVGPNGSLDLETGQGYPVSNGDRIVLDEYQVSVRITDQPPPPAVEPAYVPPDDPPPPTIRPGPAARSWNDGLPARRNSLIDGPDEPALRPAGPLVPPDLGYRSTVINDPLTAMPPIAGAGRAPAGWDTDPGATGPRPAGSPSWDKTTFNARDSSVAKPDWDKTTYTAAEPPVALPPPPVPPAVPRRETPTPSYAPAPVVVPPAVTVPGGASAAPALA